MNLVLFQPGEIDRPLPVDDPRAEHVLTVLRRQPGDSFDCGLINGPRGKATVMAIEHAGLTLRFAWGEVPPAPPNIHVWIGLPRPQTARKILNEATAAGVRSLHFFKTDKGEPSYATSTLWTSGEWQRHVTSGAEQAFCTHVPDVSWGRSLAELADALPVTGTRLALDVYEATQPLGGVLPQAPVVLAIGPERGWSADERTRLRSLGFTLCSLGTRVLRVETAITFALGVLAARGMHDPV